MSTMRQPLTRVSNEAGLLFGFVASVMSDGR